MDKPIDPEEMMNRPPAPAVPPARRLAEIARVVGDAADEAVAEHERKFHNGVLASAPSPISDELPLCAILTVVHYVGKLAKETAAEAIAEHLRLHHGRYRR